MTSLGPVYACAEYREGEDRIAGNDPRVMFYSRGPIFQDPSFWNGFGWRDLPLE